jgi:hypothetical protein
MWPISGAPGRSVMSCSASSTVEIFVIAALAACTWPYSSDNSWSGWKTSESIPTAAISVPISSAPRRSCAPGEEHRDLSRDAEQLDRREEDDESFCAYVFETRFASFSPSNSRWNARSRLNACTTAIPATDSASCAVTAAIRVRTSENAACERRWNQRVMRMPGRQDEQRDEAEAPVEQEQAADRRDEGERVHDERRQALVEHVRERVDVARQARDDPARPSVGEVAQRERREVVEQIAPQLEHDPLPDPGSISHVVVPSTHAVIPTRCRRRRHGQTLLVMALMPLSMASPTIVQPEDGRRAEIAAITITTAIRRRRPTV